jgi:predicted CoA-binding protein
LNAPKSAAILGASADPTKFGHQAVLAYQRQGYCVWPIHPRETSIAGLAVFPDIESLPGRPSIISVYVPPTILLSLLSTIADRGCDELWLNPGTDTPEVLKIAQSLNLPVICACSLAGLGLSLEAL